MLVDPNQHIKPPPPQDPNAKPVPAAVEPDLGGVAEALAPVVEPETPADERPRFDIGGLPKNWQNNPALAARLNAYAARSGLALETMANATDAPVEPQTLGEEGPDETPAVPVEPAEPAEPAEPVAAQPAQAPAPAAPVSAELPDWLPSDPVPDDPDQPARDAKAVHKEYSEAMSYGDDDRAADLYQELQSINYRDAQKRAVRERSEIEYERIAREAERAHPELAPGGDAERQAQFMTLEQMYEERGYLPHAAAHMALAALYGNGPAQAAPAPAEPIAPAQPVQAQTPVVPDQTARVQRKQTTVVHIPAASARMAPPQQPAPPKSPTQERMDYIAMRKKAAGQG